jgi:hypothetical protein
MLTKLKASKSAASFLLVANAAASPQAGPRPVLLGSASVDGNFDRLVFHSAGHHSEAAG